MASDVASVLSSPRYEFRNGDEAFQVALDVTGVKLSDMELSRRMQVLTVYGQREIGNASRTAISSIEGSTDSSYGSFLCQVRKDLDICLLYGLDMYNDTA
jgi:HSP20 family molecular chaperone IbpA